MTNQPVAWTEIPVRDLDAAARFYSAALGVELYEQQMGPDRTFVVPYGGETGISMNLQEGEPASGNGPVVHFTVPDADAAAERAKAAGGTLLSPAIEIPPGRFFYVADPDGNKIGLFEPKG